MNMKVRLANLDDIDALIAFTVHEAEEAEGFASVPKTLRKGIQAALEDNSKATYWLVVDDDDKPVGNISALKEWSDWNAGYYWWIQSMYIAPEYRGKGLVNLLVDSVVEQLKQENGIELRLYVHHENQQAKKAYEKLGFERSKYEIMTLK